MPVAIFLLSAAALAYEILLMRLLSIVQWHHFAWMVLSLALLGYGASGTFLAFAREGLVARFRVAFATLTILFSLATVGCFSLAQRVSFNALEILWNPRELLGLVALYLVLAVPFFFAATAIGLAFVRFKEDVPTLYRADLLGAGCGAIGSIAILFILTPDNALRLTSVLGFLSAAIAIGRLSGLGSLVSGLVLALLWPSAWLVPRISEFKDLSAALRIPGARVIATRTSPLGTLAVVESKRIPFRVAPGVSLNFTGSIPEQIAIYSDGTSPTVVTRFPSDVSFLDQITSAAPYHLLQRPRVVVLGSGGGMEVLNALTHGARSVDAVELNPDVVGLVRDDLREFSGGVYDRATVHIGEARGFIAHDGTKSDLIQISLLDSFGVSAAGLHGLNESYLYTVESFQQMLAGLDRGGILAVTRWLNLPPRDTLKLIATALDAMERSGVEDPEARLAIVRSWRTVTLLVKNGALTAAEIETLRRFADDRSFDLDHPAGESDRYNEIGESALGDEVVALLGPQRDELIERYKFDIAPATDDRPYFFHFFRWRAFRELVGLRASGGAFLLELGYLVVVATLVQAIAAGVLLILAPLLWRAGILPAGSRASGPPEERTPRPRYGGQNARATTYFAAIGLAFLFIEVALLQKLTLFLAHPIYAAAVAIGSFLIFAGIGSGAAPRLIGWLGNARYALLAVALLAIATLALTAGFRLFGGFPLPVKVALAIATIAPVAVAMGLAFPAGIARFGRGDDTAIPLAWAVNGCASVASAPLATLIAMHAGFTAVVISAAALYAFAAVAIDQTSSESGLAV